MGNSESTSFRITALGNGFLAIAATYLPTPFDNLSYLFVILFISCLVYSLMIFLNKSYSYRKQSFTRAASISTQINIILIILVIIAFIVKFISGYIN